MSSASRRRWPAARLRRARRRDARDDRARRRRLITLEAELDRDNGPFEATRESYNIKSRPAADGHGLEEDAILTRAHYEIRGRVSREGEGRIALAGTVHDPLDEIPIREVLRATYFEGDLSATVESAARIPAAVFAPFHHGRNDDWSALATADPRGVPTQ